MSEEKQKPHMEFRQVGAQDFLSKERDLNVWFRGAVRAALTNTENAIPDMTEEKARELFTGPINALKDFYRATMVEEATADELVGRLWTEMCRNDAGRLFMAKFAMCVFALYVDCVRRAVQKPGISKSELENSLKATDILSRLPKELAEQARPYLKVAEGFGEFVPGMYEEKEAGNGEQTERPE